MPIPRRGLKADVAFGGKVTAVSPHQTDEQKDSANKDVKPVETRGHEKVGAIDIT